MVFNYCSLDLTTPSLQLSPARGERVLKLFESQSPSPLAGEGRGEGVFLDHLRQHCLDRGKRRRRGAGMEARGRPRSDRVTQMR